MVLAVPNKRKLITVPPVENNKTGFLPNLSANSPRNGPESIAKRWKTDINNPIIRGLAFRLAAKNGSKGRISPYPATFTKRISEIINNFLFTFVLV
jgi:hypothetical protein